jgi:hypothetical protein
MTSHSGRYAPAIEPLEFEDFRLFGMIALTSGCTPASTLVISRLARVIALVR